MHGDEMAGDAGEELDVTPTVSVAHGVYVLKCDDTWHVKFNMVLFNVKLTVS